MGGTRTRPSAWQTSKYPQKIRSRSYISVAVSGSQLIKLIKSVTSLVLKKEKSLLQSAFFYEKRRLKNQRGTLWRQKKSKKSRTVPKKLKAGTL